MELRRRVRPTFCLLTHAWDTQVGEFGNDESMRKPLQTLRLQGFGAGWITRFERATF